MAAALGRNLVLEHDRRDAEPLVGVQDMDDILHVAVAVVAVDHYRQVACRHDVGDRGRDFVERDEPDVGQAPARADGREAAGEIGLEARALDQSRAQRIERARKNQWTFGLAEVMEAHCSLILPSLRMPFQRANRRPAAPDAFRSRRAGVRRGSRRAWR